MADDLRNSQVISKNNSGFPDYLDFDRLRAEGIEYLGKLAGQIWTDHNVHDPGITILEMLCYALLDLGYRTNLPVEDIFTRNPEGASKDNNFFTPAQILTCNPLTITDFRKLLVDVEEVRNAWLEPATDIVDLCRPPRQVPPDPAGGIGRDDQTACESFLNGLYHVYLDLEKDVDRDFKDEAAAQAYKNAVIDKVKKALMAHRNLCEDFADIFILCKLPIGVCAEIELEEEASPDKVYISVVEKLREFFTPSPRFYTLQQLLDKQKPIEDIFAGRPYDISQSHGFVDTEEFSALKLKKEIHLSDIYNVIFDVSGVRSIRNLSFRLCDVGAMKIRDWKFAIKKNHIPEFSIHCSGFHFSRNGTPISIDLKKYDTLLDLNFSHTGKVLYQMPSPYLDGEIPRGNYRKDLAQYYSVQNEFPRVYGIEEGGLPDDAPAPRKAQALQLKGYLLFFDQLLANYLTQLSNIRSLFALSSPEDQGEQHTYFINKLNSVPELQKLLRFQASEDGESDLGEQGSTLAFPVDKNTLLSLKERDQLMNFKVEDEKSYAFASLAEKDIALSQLKNDLYNEAFGCEFVTTSDDRVFYYILTSSDEIALVSKRYFNNLNDATLNASSVKYIGTFDENYNSFTVNIDQFSFDIELNLMSFAKYLQLLVEDRGLYLQRRQDFLQHLLARFAEKFTDYALLSFGIFSNERIEEAKIQATERFLTHYDDLSSNRGKAYDYWLNQWNNDNISGFEKRVKSITGIDNWKRHSLCNFVVDQYEEQYAVNLKIADQDFFVMNEKFDSEGEALQAAQSFFTTLADRQQYQTKYLSHEQTYSVTLNKGNQVVARFRKTYDTEDEANMVIRNLRRLFSGNPVADEDIFISQYIYFLQLNDYQANVVETSAKSYEEEAYAQSAADQLKQGVNDKKRWAPTSGKISGHGTLYRIPQGAQTPRFIDLNAFKIDIDNTIVGKPDKFTYDALDAKNQFKFRPVKEFDSQKQAKQHWKDLLTWMTSADNYRIQPAGETGKFELHIFVKDEDKAVCSASFKSEYDAQKMQDKVLDIIRPHLYSLTIQEVPNRWKFTYHAGIDLAESFSFQSVSDYKNQEEALNAAETFRIAIPTLQLRKYKGALRLVAGKTKEKISPVELIQNPEDRDENIIRASINQGLSAQREVIQLLESATPKDFTASVGLDAPTRQGLYVYRLIDKDRVPAQYSEIFNDRAEVEARKNALAKIKCGDYSYLEICLGGDIIDVRQDKTTKTPWYHYLVKSRNRFDQEGEELVLFESILGYQTEEDAQKAFKNNYLRILTLASDVINYGKIISTEEKIIHSQDSCISAESLVFVPKATLDALGGYEDASIQALVELANSYPIRQVEFQSDAFYEIFPCEEKTVEPKSVGCGTAEKDYVYYFRLFGIQSAGTQNKPYWQSKKIYSDPEEARKEFYFFLMLLCYPGNFFVDCDICDAETINSYRIYIREVLVESTGRFPSEAEAWGPEGVQKFICVSQSQNAFHNYQRRDDCCYSFYVACADGLIYHPCHYDHPQKRNAAIEKLYSGINNQNKTRAYRWQVSENEEGYILLNEKGQPFAIANLRAENDPCGDLVLFFDKVVKDQVTYLKDDNGAVYARDDQSGIVVYQYQDIEEATWKETLKMFSCYFPVVRQIDEKTGRTTYCVEIQLPGFTACGEEPNEDQPCGCSEKSAQPLPTCYVAWKSRCCYTTCEEAMSVWRTGIMLLLRYENYRAWFDCTCYDFGIEMYYNMLEQEQGLLAGETRFSLGDSEMLALNPQCYSNPDMVCEAVERSWKLVNCEGLHAVEHILLRPRCPEDCQCEQYSARCDNQTNCNFIWSGPDDDPCSDQPDVCFVPGVDPYSFIATVVLPAWPVRFRRTENRRLLENILYREAPAHVLLRILWLAPHDFCCFESKYKNWGSWLARKKVCGEQFSNCDFLSFLFQRNYECLSDCDECLPCQDNGSLVDPCFDEILRQSDDLNQYLNQINELYCWRTQVCDAYEFTGCDAPIDRGNGNEGGVILLSKPASAVSPSVEKSEEMSQTAPPLESSQEKPENQIISKEQQPASILKTKPQLINGRMAKFRTIVDEVAKKLKDNPLVGKIQVFLKDPQPSATRASKLLTEVVQNNKPAKAKALTKKQVFILLQSALCYYLDKICFNGKDLGKIRTLKNTLEELRKVKTDMLAIYQYWDPEEVEKYEPELDMDEIKKILTEPA